MTGKRSRSVQWDLFDSSGTQEMQRRVRELDALIADALRKNDYENAKILTKEQESLIHQLVQLGELDETDEP